MNTTKSHLSSDMAGRSDEQPVLDDTKTDAAPAQADTVEEVEGLIRGSARDLVQTAHTHENLTFLPLRWIHNGPFVLKGAQAVLVRRHKDNTFKGMYLAFETWRKRRKADPYVRKERVLLNLTATGELLDYLHEAEASANVAGGTYLVLPAAEVFDNLDQTQQQTFATILRDIAQSRRISDLLSAGQLSIEALDNLAAATQHARYKAALAELRDMVAGKTHRHKRDGSTAPLTEHDYQKWFEEHTWVFGTEYIRRINLREIEPHATVDLILATADGFYDVLELKLPDATILSYDSSHKTYYWTAEVAKVIAQAAKYLNAIERSADRIRIDEKVAMIRPRVRIVIGRSNAWSEEQHEAFRRLGATLHGIEIMTYDHVIERAQQLVAQYEQGIAAETPE